VVGSTVVVVAVVVGSVASTLRWLATARTEPGLSHCPEAAAPTMTTTMMDVGIDRRSTG
jgi:hypothetical protein